MSLQPLRPELQKLFVDWLIRLLDERYGVKGWGSPGAGRWSVTLADDSTVLVEFDRLGQPAVQGPAEWEDDLASIVENAHRQTLALDFGEGAWWKVSFSTDMSDAGLMGVTMLHFMRIKSEHNSRRFQGDWRLGRGALVSFQQAEQAPVPSWDFSDHRLIYTIPINGSRRQCGFAVERGFLCITCTQ
jgi:hypothetical protein